MKYHTVNIDQEPEVLQHFFQQLRDEATLIEHQGKALCVLYPAARLAYHPEGALQDAAGAWQLPDDIARAIAGDIA
jgi:hypothetical protein